MSSKKEKKRKVDRKKKEMCPLGSLLIFFKDDTASISALLNICNETPKTPKAFFFFFLSNLSANSYPFQWRSVAEPTEQSNYSSLLLPNKSPLWMQR